MKASIGFLALLGVAADAYRMHIKESHPVPHGWTKVDKAPADHKIKLSIGLTQSNFDELERQLYEVSDPSHSRYGQHLSQAEVDDLVRPTEESSSLVKEWLKEHDIHEHHTTSNSAGDWISFFLPVSAIEKMLDTEYHVYRHDDGTHLVRAPSWSLPDFLHKHVTAVQPTNSFFRAAPRARTFKPVTGLVEGVAGFAGVDGTSSIVDGTAAAPAACNTNGVTPACLRTYYQTINYTPKSAGKNRVGIANYLGEANNRSDVKIFLSQYRPDAVSAAYSFKTYVINNGSDQQTPLSPAQLAAGTDAEGNLDAETVLGIGYPTPLSTFNTGGSPPFKPDANEQTNSNEPYLDFVNYVLALSDDVIPQVITTSYGDDEQTVPLSYAQTVCKQFAQLGARGVSLLFSSGDSGVGPTGKCTSNDGKNTAQFIPSFPDGCPYITSVGATKNFAPEVAAYDANNGFASGGGFSNYFARPSYQDAAVTGYLKTLGTQYAGLYNKTGRAYPDISAQGQRYITIWNGSQLILDGTSASCPAAGSIISLVNDALITAGKSPLGFLNPWLYSNGYKAFHDITSGSAIGCGVAGFPAAAGWDAVTGFGTPFFKNITANLGV